MNVVFAKCTTITTSLRRLRAINVACPHWGQATFIRSLDLRSTDRPHRIPSVYTVVMPPLTYSRSQSCHLVYMGQHFNDSWTRIYRAVKSVVQPTWMMRSSTATLGRLSTASVLWSSANPLCICFLEPTENFGRQIRQLVIRATNLAKNGGHSVQSKTTDQEAGECKHSIEWSETCEEVFTTLKAGQSLVSAEKSWLHPVLPGASKRLRYNPKNITQGWSGTATNRPLEPKTTSS